MDFVSSDLSIVKWQTESRTQIQSESRKDHKIQLVVICEIMPLLVFNKKSDFKSGW